MSQHNRDTSFTKIYTIECLCACFSSNTKLVSAWFVSTSKSFKVTWTYETPTSVCYSRYVICWCKLCFGMWMLFLVVSSSLNFNCTATFINKGHSKCFTKTESLWELKPNLNSLTKYGRKWENMVRNAYDLVWKVSNYGKSLLEITYL